jgi:ergothioneine biosynthesis protein EgtB
MHDASLTPESAAWARTAGRAGLSEMLLASRADTLATLDAWEAALPELRVPQIPQLNPPAWELGHIGWFQAWWTTRNPQRRAGRHANPAAPRGPADPPDADALYDSSRIAHASRWSLPLPDIAATRARLARQLEATLAQLAAEPDDGDETLYCYRLALLHEDMHHEAALYMARHLGIPIIDPRWQAPRLPEPPAACPLATGSWRLGHPDDGGFVFDNEVPATTVLTTATVIDAQVVRWAEYLPFVADGGYRTARWWDADGLAWKAATGARAPRYLRQETGAWQQWRHGQWMTLDATEPACHLSRHEARAWCRWAGRRLPTEAEWERAALSAGPGFRWGDVWEWTDSPFAPFPGFVAHPYRHYSAPWFDGRPVLRGASFLTQPRMRHARYRNFFPAERNDVPAGFRSCPPGG